MKKVYLNKNPLNSVMLNTVFLNGGGLVKKGQGGVIDEGYIKFQDPEVLRVLLANGVGADGGITKEEAAAVTSIGTWFKGNTVIETFDEFEKFTSVTALGSNNNTNNAPFANCTNLKSIKLHENIEHIYTNSFNNCTSLIIEQLKLPKLKTLQSNSFYGCKIKKINDLGSITFVGGSNNIYSGAFGKCVELTEAVLPETLTEISSYAFYDCTNLYEINLPNAIKKIGAQAFYNCTSLAIEDLSLPNLETLGQNAFYGVKIKKISNLGKITALPTGTSSTQNFGDKSVLEEIILPNNVTNIPSWSFRGYAALREIKGLQNVTIINSDGFGETTELKMDMILPNLTFLGAAAFYKSGITSFIANSLEEIASNYEPMAYCPNLKRVELRSIKAIKSPSVFRYNPNLEEVILSNDLTYLERLTFQNCKKLKHIELGENIQTLNGGVFESCSGLEYIICRTATPPSGVNNYTFYQSDCPIYVSDDSVTAYREASGWSAYADRIKPLSEYTE